MCVALVLHCHMLMVHVSPSALVPANSALIFWCGGQALILNVSLKVPPLAVTFGARVTRKSDFAIFGS